jgi:hypothetical protein
MGMGAIGHPRVAAAEILRSSFLFFVSCFFVRFAFCCRTRSGHLLHMHTPLR